MSAGLPALTPETAPLCEEYEQPLKKHPLFPLRRALGGLDSVVMRTLLIAAALPAILALNPALAAGCWEPTTPLGTTLHVGAEEILVGDQFVCEVGSIEEATYRAGCMSDDGKISFLSITEGAETASVTWNEDAPLTYRRCL